MSEEQGFEGQIEGLEPNIEAAIDVETEPVDDGERVEEIVRQVRQRRRRKLRIAPGVEALLLLIVFGLGLGSGYVAWGINRSSSS